MDAVDAALDQWRIRRPDLDTRAMGVLGRISRAQHLLSQDLQRLHGAHGLEPWAFDVLATLLRSGDVTLTPSRLARRTMVGNAAMTHRLDRLVERGVISRTVNEANRREVLISLTTEGHDLVEKLLPEHVANQNRFLSALSADDAEQLSELLRKLLLSHGDLPAGTPAD